MLLRYITGLSCTVSFLSILYLYLECNQPASHTHKKKKNKKRSNPSLICPSCVSSDAWGNQSQWNSWNILLNKEKKKTQYLILAQCYLTCNVKVASGLIKADHPGLVQCPSSLHEQLSPKHFHIGILLGILVQQSIHLPGINNWLEGKKKSGSLMYHDPSLCITNILPPILWWSGPSR